MSGGRLAFLSPVSLIPFSRYAGRHTSRPTATPSTGSQSAPDERIAPAQLQALGWRVTEQLTIIRLEQVVALLQAHVDVL